MKIATNPTALERIERPKIGLLLVGAPKRSSRLPH